MYVLCCANCLRNEISVIVAKPHLHLNNFQPVFTMHRDTQFAAFLLTSLNQLYRSLFMPIRSLLTFSEPWATSCRQHPSTKLFSEAYGVYRCVRNFRYRVWIPALWFSSSWTLLQRQILGLPSHQLFSYRGSTGINSRSIQRGAGSGASPKHWMSMLAEGPAVTNGVAAAWHLSCIGPEWSQIAMWLLCA